MNFVDAVTSCFSRYSIFAGLAARSECLWFWLFNGMVTLIRGLMFVSLIGWIFLLIWTCAKGDAGTNRYGYGPLDRFRSPVP